MLGQEQIKNYFKYLNNRNKLKEKTMVHYLSCPKTKIVDSFYHKKILDQYVPEISFVKGDKSDGYYIIADWPIFSNQHKEKLLLSLTKSKHRDNYTYNFSDMLDNNKFNSCLEKRALVPTAELEKKTDPDPQLNPRLFIEKAELIKDTNKLFHWVQNFQNFSFCLMNAYKLIYIQQPWTPKNQLDEEVEHSYKDFFLLPHFNLEYRIIGGDIITLLTELTFNQNLMDNLEVFNENTENFYNDFSYLNQLKCRNWMKFYSKLQKFQCDLNIKSKKMDRNLLYLTKQDNKKCSGYIELVKHYFIYDSSWRLSLIIVFHPDLEQLKYQSIFKFTKNQINSEKKKANPDLKVNYKICEFMNDDKQWNETVAKQFLKRNRKKKIKTL